IKTQEQVDREKLPARNPVIAIMGHVDHGKTSLLDYIRKAKVAAGEAGGITQHIGAYTVSVKDKSITFLDTPGHAAFAQMRQRGANITDIVVLVVAADDGVMPQTKESIRYCKNAGVPIIVAVNKMDKPGASPEKIKQDLMEFELTPEEWGGDTQYVPLSALTGNGVDSLLESILIQAEVLDLRESNKGAAQGVVIESKIEVGRGPVATILIRKGTLNKGDSIVVGECWGRARSLMDYTGKLVDEAGPSTPIQILGLDQAPSPGDILNVVKNDKEAKRVVENRVDERKALDQAGRKKIQSLEDFFASAAEEDGSKKMLKLIVRTDVLGSFEAIKSAVESLGNSEVGVQVIGGGVGAITDSDIELAASSKGYVIGFNMRPVTSARKLSEMKGVDVKTYSIIYELINQITLALEGMLTPEFEEKFIGRAQVKETFTIPKAGTIAGSSVIDGKIERGCNIRLLRDGKIVFDGKLSSLKRFKDDVREVKNGYECGIGLENFNDVKVDDLFEAYILEKKERKLDSATSL
ncbi:MAG: translation initiation factor IF-2, partial [Bacteriovoracaceae bacterium]|nr:translation initiation factor IF-2 [Bacteriovoracaceae bacterium]